MQTRLALLFRPKENFLYHQCHSIGMIEVEAMKQVENPKLTSYVQYITSHFGSTRDRCIVELVKHYQRCLE